MIDDDIILIRKTIKDQQLLSRLIVGRNGSGVVQEEIKPRLQRLVIGNYGLGIETSGYTYFSNYFKRFDKDVLDYYNFIDNSTGEQITNIYPTSSYFLQSAIFINEASEDNEFIDEYLPNSSEGLLHLSQIGETVLGISPFTSNYKQTRFITNPDDLFPTLPISTVNFEWHKDYEAMIPYVALYSPSSIIALQSPSSEAFDPSYALSGVYYNYLVDVDVENNDKKINRYDGIMYSMHGPMKNFYNSQWDVEARIYENPSDNISAATLKNTRQYRNINTNIETIWASYTFGNDYTMVGTEVDKATANSPSLTATTRTSFKVATEIPMEISNSTPLNDAHAYEHIERVKGFFVLGKEQLHKSNMFSVRINNSNLNSRITDTDQRKEIQTTINNDIKKIIDKWALASTQLFKIFWTGY